MKRSEPVGADRHPALSVKTVPEPLQRIRNFCVGTPFMLITFFAAALIITLGIEVPGAVFFVLLISALLIICDDLMAILFPILAVCIAMLQCYDSFNTFIRLAFLAVIPVGALIFHFVYYKTSFRVGKSFPGLVAVAVAVTFGGLFTIPAKEYFSPTALYYTVMLGVGMVGIYLLVKSQSAPKAGSGEKFIFILFLMGMLACFHTFEIYFECMTQGSEEWGRAHGLEQACYMRYANGMTLSDIVSELSVGLFGVRSTYLSARLQPGNNLSTFLLISMPAGFFLSMKKSRFFLLSVPLTLFSIYLTRSRGGIVMAFAELFFCLLFVSIGEKRKVTKGIFIGATVIYFVTGVILAVRYSAYDRIVSIIADQSEARAKLLFRSLEDFSEAPWFGKGLGNMANRDLYEGKTGTLPWYHMMIPQIIGSMGTLGLVGYIFRFAVQVRLVWQKRSIMTAAFALSYLGLLLMSQVNPGEFCPIPYGMIATLLFIMIEEEPDADAGKQVYRKARHGHRRH